MTWIKWRWGLFFWGGWGGWGGGERGVGRGGGGGVLTETSD